MKMSLAAARVNAGLTQKEAAQRLSFGQNTLVDIENGKKYPTKEQLIEFCQLYGCSPSDIKCKVFILAEV